MMHPLCRKEWKLKKFEKLVANFYDKEESVIHINNFKKTWNHGLVLKKVHIIINFNQKAWLKPYIDIDTDLRKKAKNDFEEKFDE